MDFIKIKKIIIFVLALPALYLIASNMSLIFNRPDIKNINVPRKYQSIFLPEENVWNKCWSLPILSFEKKKDLALNWNNA